MLQNALLPGTVQEGGVASSSTLGYQGLVPHVRGPATVHSMEGASQKAPCLRALLQSASSLRRLVRPVSTGSCGC